MSAAATVLPDDVAFDAEGHASEVALSALADGQIEILGAKLEAHVEGCPICTTRLGEAALLSAHVGDALFHWGRERPQSDVGRERPRPPAADADAALLSRDGKAGFDMPQAIRPAAVRRPLPFLAIAAALVVAILCAGPSFADPTGAPRWHTWVRAPLWLLRDVAWMLVRIAWHPSPAKAALQWASSGVFIVVAIVVAVRLGRRGSAQGEVS